MSNTVTATKHIPTPYTAKKGLHGNPDGVTLWQAKLPGMIGAKGIAKMSGVHEQDEVEATAAFIVRACNLHAVLLEYFHASNSFDFTVGHEEATVEDERKAQERFDAAAVAVRAALAAAES